MYIWNEILNFVNKTLMENYLYYEDLFQVLESVGMYKVFNESFESLDYNEKYLEFNGISKALPILDHYGIHIILNDLDFYNVIEDNCQLDEWLEMVN